MTAKQKIDKTEGSEVGRGSTRGKPKFKFTKLFTGGNKMGVLNQVFTDGHYCKGCGEFFFSKSSMVTLNGYEGSGTYCVCCAKEIIEEEMED